MKWLSVLIEKRHEYKMAQLRDFQRRRNEEDEYRMKKDRYRLLREVKQSWTHRNKLRDVSENFFVFYHFYENQFGERKVDITCDNPKLMNDCYKDDEFYLTMVQPFLRGAYLKDIPTYDDAGMDEMQDRLKK